MKLAVFQKTSLAQNVGRTQHKGQQPLVLPSNPGRRLVVVQSKKSQPIEPGKWIVSSVICSPLSILSPSLIHPPLYTLCSS